MECNKDGTLVLTGSTDGQAKLINTSTGKVRTSVIVLGSMHLLQWCLTPFLQCIFLGFILLSNTIVKNQECNNEIQFSSDFFYVTFLTMEDTMQLYRNLDIHSEIYPLL